MRTSNDCNRQIDCMSLTMGCHISLQIPYLHKIGVFGISDSYHSMNFLNQLLFLIIIKLHVPFGQSCLSCSVLDEDEANLRDK